jgi:hypothetical protein
LVASAGVVSASDAGVGGGCGVGVAALAAVLGAAPVGVRNWPNEGSGRCCRRRRCIRLGCGWYEKDYQVYGYDYGATGRVVAFGTVDAMRVRGGKITDHCGVANLYSVVQQLGATP